MISNKGSTVIGSNFAALVYATTRSNYEYIDYVYDARHRNHFAGTKLGDEWVDLGMILLEPTVATSQKAIISYSGEVRDEATSFVHEFFTWLTTREIPVGRTVVKTFFRGELVEDFFIADSLEILDTLTKSERNSSNAELLEIIRCKNHERHPSRKRESMWFKTATYQQSSIGAMGWTITNLILEPWLTKVYGTDFESLLAIEHRGAWVPLFYPESLLEYLGSGNISFQQPIFAYPVNNSFASVVRHMTRIIDSKCNIIAAHNFEIENLGKHSDVVYFGSPEFMVGRSAISSDRIIVSEGKFRKKMSPGKVVYLECSESAPITVFVVDIEKKAFRLSVRPSGSGKGTVAIVEYGHCAFDLSENELIADARETVESMVGVSTLGESVATEIAFPSRTSGFLEVDQLYTRSKAMLTDLGWLGTPIGELNSSMNDQACAALHATSVRERYSV